MPPAPMKRPNASGSARATALAAAKNGRLKSKRAKVGGRCSQAMSDWKTSGMTPAIAKTLGECRSIAHHAKRAENHRGAGREAMAQAIEHRVAKAQAGKAPLTAKERTARVKELVAKRAEANRAREERKAASKAPAHTPAGRHLSPQARNLLAQARTIRDADATAPFPEARKLYNRVKGRVEGRYVRGVEARPAPPSRPSLRDQAAAHRATKGPAEQRARELANRLSLRAHNLHGDRQVLKSIETRRSITAQTQGGASLDAITAKIDLDGMRKRVARKTAAQKRAKAIVEKYNLPKTLKEQAQREAAKATAPQPVARAATPRASNRHTPDRLDLAAARRVDRAFQRSPGVKDNFVAIADVRAKLGGTREWQDDQIRRARKAGVFTADTHEGLHNPHPERLKAILGGTIREAGSNFAYLSRRGDRPTVPMRGTGKGKRARLGGGPATDAARKAAAGVGVSGPSLREQAAKNAVARARKTIHVTNVDPKDVAAKARERTREARRIRAARKLLRSEAPPVQAATERQRRYAEDVRRKETEAQLRQFQSARKGTVKDRRYRAGSWREALIGAAKSHRRKDARLILDAR